MESNADIRASLREVFFTGAKEIDAAGKKAICIQVPVPQQKTFQKIQVLLFSVAGMFKQQVYKCLPCIYSVASSHD